MSSIERGAGDPTMTIWTAGAGQEVQEHGRRSTLRRVQTLAIFGAGLALGVLGAVYFALGPGAGEKSGVLPPLTAAALELHRAATIADLHIDPLLWNRDLMKRSEQGDVDLPRLREGGVDVGVFGVVSAGLPIIGGWRLFTWWRDWKPESRRSRWASAMDQIERLDSFIAASGGQLVLTRSAAEIDEAVAQGRLAAMLGVEGAHALDGDVSRVRTLHERGVIYMGPVHLSANELGGSSYWLGDRGGMTDYGRQVVQEMESVGMFIDTAHLSEAAFWEVMNTTKGPVLCSHTGIDAIEPSWRNLKDDQLKAIADRGGVVGIMLATNFLGGRRIEHWVAHVKHAVQVMGVEHVALGSDYDGFIPVPDDARDIASLPRLTAALLDAGFSSDDVRRIMGGNFLDMVRRYRPYSH